MMPNSESYIVTWVDDAEERVTLTGADGPVAAARTAYTPITTQKVRLRPGDRFEGIVWEGTAIGHVTRAAPPAELVAHFRDLLERLCDLGFRASRSPAELATMSWQGNDDPPTTHGLLRDDARRMLPRLLIWSTHPFDDPELGCLNLVAMARWLEGLVVRDGGGLSSDFERGCHFLVDPGAVVVPYGEVDDEMPDLLFGPLAAHLNERLRAAGAAVEWSRTPGNWFLATPVLAALLRSEHIV
jgi:hypothetical protein